MDEDLVFTHCLFERLVLALEALHVDPKITNFIFEQRNHPEMQRVLDDMAKATAMVVERHHNTLGTFSRIRESLRIKKEIPPET